jgi:hypothetical protein
LFTFFIFLNQTSAILLGRIGPDSYRGTLVLFFFTQLIIQAKSQSL